MQTKSIFKSLAEMSSNPYRAVLVLFMSTAIAAFYFEICLCVRDVFSWTCERFLLKTLWKKEKMLVTSIFSFFHDVFKPFKGKLQHLNLNSFVMVSIWIGLNFLRFSVKITYRKWVVCTGMYV